MPQIITSKSYENCKLCSNFKESRDGDSTPKDVIISVIYNQMYNNLIQFPEMLRSVGSKASVVYLIEKRTLQIMDMSALKDIEDCGVTIIPINRTFRRNIYA